LDGIKYLNKDDIESFFYLLISLAKGVLPWINVPIVQVDNYYGILKAKMNATSKSLWVGLPKSFEILYDYIRNLDNLEPIKYDYIEELLYKAAKETSIRIAVSKL